MARIPSKLSLLVTGALALVLAACGGSSGGGGSGARPKTLRGAVTAASAGSITVNGVQMSTQGAAITGSAAALQKGMVVTAEGTFDDRTGGAAEIEVEHGIEGRVDSTGPDSMVVGGTTVRVDDSTEFGEDNPLRLGSVAAGDVVAVSGVPDDRGGLRASRVDDSPRNGGLSSDDDDLDVKGFVSNLVAGTSFELRLSPDATSWYLVDISGLASTPAGLENGAYVEVHTLSAPVAGTGPVIATLLASSIEIEDRFGQAEVEIEGIVTSGTDAEFVVEGVTVVTSGSTRWELGGPEDLIPGVKVEAEGQLDGAGVLHADKVSFRPGNRLTAWIDSLDSGSMTILGVPVQLPTWVDNDRGALSVGLKVEVRGNPKASGEGLVAYRLVPPTGNEDRVFIRAVAAAKASREAPTFTVMGFSVSTAGAVFRMDTNGDGVKESVPASTFYDAVEAGRTVLKVRAATVGDVNPSAKTWQADEVEIEGEDG